MIAGDGGRKKRLSIVERMVESLSRTMMREYWVWLNARSLVYESAQFGP